MPSTTSTGPEKNPTAESRLTRFVRGLDPYQSLILVLVPLSVVEPLKLVAVAIAGEGHWITGIAMIAAAYAVSLFFVERLFRLVKPKLLMLPWFARLWGWYVALRGKLASKLIPRSARPASDRRAANPETR
jgi:hypothetical protein